MAIPAPPGDGDLIAGRFAVLSVLGKGGGGQVALVEDRQAGGRLAMKILREPEDPAAIQRFRREFAIQRELSHPSIVAVRDFLALPGGGYAFTMDVVEGKNLKDAAAELGLPERLDLLGQVAGAIDFLHAHGLVHMDLKPTNTMVDAAGHAHLLDFGLTERRTLHDTATLRGTVAYMSPEMIRGGVVGPAADVYALGVMAYELVVGRSPFEGSAVELLRKHRDEPAPRATSLRPELPPQVDEPLARLLEKEPSLRYARGRDAIDDVKRALGLEVDADAGTTLVARSRGLVGRDRELDRLDDAWCGVVGDSAATTAIVSGPPGVGKSRLMEELAVKVQLRGGHVATVPLEESALATLARAAARELGDRLRGAAELRPDDALLELGSRSLHHLPRHVLGEAFARDAPVGDGAPPAAEGDRPAEAALAYLLWCALQRGPLLVVVERCRDHGRDLVELAARLRRALFDQQLMIVAEIGDVTAPQPAADHAVELGPLSDDEIAEVVSNHLGNELPEGLTVWVTAHAAGLPALVPTLLGVLAAGGTLVERQGRWFLLDDLPEVRRAEGRAGETWLAAIPGAVRRWLEAAAVVGDAFDDAVVAAVAQAPSATAAAAALRLVEPASADRHRFVLPTVREALLAALHEEERAVLHERAAAAVASAGGGAADLARHLAATLDPGRAFAPTLEAARTHEASGAPRSALLAYRKALELVDAGKAVASTEVIASILDRLAEIEERLGEGAAAEATLGRLLGASTAARPVVARRLAKLRIARGRVREAAVLLMEELGRAGSSTDAAAKVPLLVLLARARLVAGEAAAARDILLSAKELLRQDDPPSLHAMALNPLGIIHRQLGDLQASVQVLEQAVGLLQGSPDSRGLSAVLTSLGNTHIMAEDPERALRCLREAEELCRGAGDLERLAIVAANMGQLETTGLSLPDRIQRLERARLIHERLGKPHELVTTGTILAEALRGRGELGRALELADDCVALGERHGFSRAVAEAATIRAHIAADLDRPDARSLAEAASAAIDALGGNAPGGSALARAPLELLFARLDLRDGEPAAAAARASAVLERLAGPQASTLEARARLVLAAAARSPREAATQVELAERAVERLPLWLARIDVELQVAEAQSALRRHAEAITRLDRVAEAAREAGALGLERRARRARRRVADLALVEGHTGAIDDVKRLELALGRARRDGDSDLIWRCLARLGSIYQRAGIRSRASDYCQEAIRELRQRIAALSDDTLKSELLEETAVVSLLADVERLRGEARP